jgi:divalent metal cation (Fe/Co/Zn/Cd) transporter
VESLSNPSEGHILPGILLQEAIEANEWHHINDIHYQIITLISYVYRILYTYIVYDIVFDVD